MPDTPRKLRVIDSPDPERPPPAPEAPREKLKLGTKQIDEVNRPFEATTPPITVHGILAENLRQALPAEKPLNLRKPRSRRKRDYWLLMVLGNSPLALEFFLPGTIAFALIWCFVFSVMTTWIMWFVMSDY